MALKIRRGTNAERAVVTFAEGELVYVIDTDELYIGDGSTLGGIRLAGSALSSIGTMLVADTINNELDLQRNLNLSGNNIVGTGNINITGSINASGNITAGGNIDIGDNTNDTLTILAQVDSNITPITDSAYDLGGVSKRWRNGYFAGLIVDGQVDAVAVNADIVADNSTVMVDVSANTFAGTLVGNVQGNVQGNLTGNSTGYHTGDVKGSVFSDDSVLIVDAVNGVVTANLVGDVDGNITGNVKSQNGVTILNSGTNGTNASYIGSVQGNVSGNLTGDVLGNVQGNLTGNSTGFHTGDIKGSVFADDSTLLVDAVAGIVPGAVISGTVTANLVGNVQGNVTGNVNGTLTGNVVTNLIDSADSSFINCVPLFQFNSDVIVDNDIIAEGNVKVTDGVLYTGNIESSYGDQAPVFFNSNVEFNRNVIFNSAMNSLVDFNCLGQIGSTSAIGVGIFNGPTVPATPTTTISNTLANFGTPVQFKSYTTTERDAFTSVNPGTVIYNSTLNKFQGYVSDTGGGSPGWMNFN